MTPEELGELFEVAAGIPQGRVVTPEELGELFESFTVSAFRLECLPSYDVTEDDEAEAWQQFRHGRPEPPWKKDRLWLQTVRAAKQRGARMQRVRMVESPATDYQRFQCAWGYPANVAAGEDIRILDHKPNGLLALDYWLFDDEVAVVLEYDDDGRFLVPVVAETLQPYRQARDLALRRAIPFERYRLSLLR